MKLRVPAYLLPLEYVERALWGQKLDNLLLDSGDKILQIILFQGGTPTQAVTAIKAVLMSMKDDGRLHDFKVEGLWSAGSLHQAEPDKVWIHYSRTPGRWCSRIHDLHLNI